MSGRRNGRAASGRPATGAPGGTGDLPTGSTVVRSVFRPSDLPGVAWAAASHVGAVLTGRYRHTVGAVALIRDAEGRICLVRSGVRRRRWTLPGGGVERGEAPGETVVREVLEETGLTVEVEGLCGAAWSPESLALVFHCRLVEGELRPAPVEIARAGWFPVDEARKRLHPRALPHLEVGLATSAAERYRVDRPS